MRFFIAIYFLLSIGLFANGQRTPVDDDGRVVNFARDIAPIFRENCVECHGNGESKGDFQIDDVDTVMGYIDVGDAESSSLYVDYLISDDEDTVMPPGGAPLQPQELALIRVWIDEGASWPAGFQLTGVSVVADPVPTVTPNTSLLGRVWAAQGFLHPATVHFPIALLLLGAAFVVLGWKWPMVGTQIPLACLIIGALTAIASTAMGWSFAVERGYGSWDQFDAAAMEKEVFWHRWSGVIVTVLATFFAVVALLAIKKKDSKKLHFLWKLGLLICAAMVGAVGHQGGEMSYGADFYPQMLRILFGHSKEEPSAPLQAENDGELQSMHRRFQSTTAANHVSEQAIESFVIDH